MIPFAHANLLDIPENAKSLSQKFSSEGCYVLALAYKKLSYDNPKDITNLKKMSRKEAENELRILGLLLIRNEVL